jgi:hypothetical protein
VVAEPFRGSADRLKLTGWPATHAEALALRVAVGAKLDDTATWLGPLWARAVQEAVQAEAPAELVVPVGQA